MTVELGFKTHVFLVFLNVKTPKLQIFSFWSCFKWHTGVYCEYLLRLL